MTSNTIEKQHVASLNQDELGSIKENQLTVRNENLFNLMQQSAERENQHKINLSKIMGGLQTYKQKLSKRDPSRRVNIPYYHKVISRSRYKPVSVTTAPSQAIMFSKQLPLLERKK